MIPAMILEQLYLGCLSQASYLIADIGTATAAIVDPRRDIDDYLARTHELGVEIKHVLLTHFHADFASGHLELQQRCGATIYLGAGASPDYPHQNLADGETIEFGRVRLQALATPGHTPESTSFLVFDLEGGDEPQAVLTGDTLFIGDVGRPDLLGSVGRTAEEMAGHLYRSLRDKLMTLPPATTVYPGHGAGSMCGKNLSRETVSTIGDQLRDNCALQPMDEDAFVAMITANQPQAPAYFGYDAGFNKRLHPTLSETREASLRPLAAAEFLAEREGGSQVLDVRWAEDYAAEHVQGSVNVGLTGQFATWCGSVLDPNRPIVLLAEPGHEAEAVIRLGRIGFDNVIGYVDGGIATLRQPATQALLTQIHRVKVDAFRDHRAAQEQRDGVLLDVRNPGEWEGGTIPGAACIPLGQLRDRLDELPKDRPITVYCAGGYRSATAMGMIEGWGNADVTDLVGGYMAYVGHE